MTENIDDQINSTLAGMDIEAFLALPAVQDKIGDVRTIIINACPSFAKETEYSEADLFDVEVTWRSKDRYAVEHRGKQYTKDLNSAMESNPSSRTKRFIDSHRFPLGKALALAHKLAPKVQINRLTPETYGYWVIAASLASDLEASGKISEQSKLTAYREECFELLKTEQARTAKTKA